MPPRDPVIISASKTCQKKSDFYNAAMFVLFLCFIFFFLIPPEISADEFSFSDFSHFASRSWNAPSDLPHGNVTSFYRDESGLVWAGSAEGLARIDSKSSKFFATSTKPSILNNKINDLAGCNGKIFVATSTGISEISGSGISSKPLAKQHAFFDVEALGDCTLFAADEKGIYLIRDNKINKLKTENTSVTVLFSDGRTLFAGFSDGAVRSYSNGAFSDNLCPANRSAVKSGAAENGRVLVGTEDGSVFQIENGKCLKLLQNQDKNAVTSLDFNSKTTAFASGGKLFFAENGVVKPCGDLCRDSESVAEVKIDGDFLWLAGSRGVTLFYPGKFMTLGRESGLFSEKVYALIEDDSGRIWAGTRGGGLFFYENGRFKYLRDRKGDIGRFVGGLFQNEDGRILVGTPTGIVSFLPEKPNVFNKMKNENNIPVNAVGVIFRDRKSRLWAGGGGGAIYLNTAKGWHLLRKFGDDSDFVSSIAEDDAGNLWFAASKGVWKLDENDEFHEINRELAGDMPVSLYPAGNGNILVGTMNRGLVLIDREQKIFRIDSRKGLCSDTVLGILPDDDGNLWFSSTKGVFSLPQSLVLNVATAENESVFCNLSGAADGIRRPESTGGVQPSVLKRRNGDLWFPTLEGIAVLKKNGREPVKFDSVAPEESAAIIVKNEEKSNYFWIFAVLAVSAALIGVFVVKRPHPRPLSDLTPDPSLTLPTTPLQCDEGRKIESSDLTPERRGEEDLTPDPSPVWRGEEEPDPEPVSETAEEEDLIPDPSPEWRGEEKPEIFDPAVDEVGEKQKYEGYQLDDEIAAAYAKEAKELMEKEKLYRNPDLTLPGLAKKLKLSANTLSQVLNGYCGQTFYNFVNSYRLEEVAAMMRDPKFDDKSVLELLYEAGFKSKSTFNPIFKKWTGKTPSEYRKEIQEKR